MRSYLAYILLLILVVCFTYLFVDANFPYQITLAKEFAYWYRAPATFLYLLVILLAYSLYTLWLFFIRNGKVFVSTAKKVSIVTVLTLLFAYPALSHDIFNYIATSKVLFIYKENPYIVMPIEIKNEPFLEFMHAANKTALYGPVWILVTGIPLLLGSGSLLGTIISFKILNIFFFFATCWLLWRLTDKNLFAVSLFAFNPLVVIETIVNGHNDIAMIFFLLGSVYLLRHKKLLFSLILLICSILIKFASVFMVPVYIYVLYRYLYDKKISWQSVYWYMFLSMLAIFLLSPLREEMYPWYAQWFLVFVPLIVHKQFAAYMSLVLSFGLLLRYIPFMLLGTHFGVTPYLRISFVIVLLLIGYLFWLLKKRQITQFFS